MAKDNDHETLLKRATLQMQSIGNRPIIIETSLVTVLDLISMVQLGLRHPGTKTNAIAGRTETFIRKLIEQVDPDHGDLWRLLQLGFDPDHDVA